MRLSHIKLAGFKSFVDPTTVAFPGNLSGVVGPNGCGKSNIIDAVRWVMGESSAKNLRADTMDDVIFNGSTKRSPSSQAAVELHFDNAEGRLGGPYAQYGEIVIRRQVSMDGQSTYYLNNTVCRRRDIRDIFLGTGLGPRSYAIIEQGMISRLIEAKPEELRIYLEEAAGISKYKERRRETELRLQHTRDNLARLMDLRDELQKQLDHLTKQAESAEKYQSLKDQEKILRAQLLALRAKQLEIQMDIEQQQISHLENQLEKINAEYQSVFTQREVEQQKQTQSNDEVQEAQRIFYQLNTELARVEQTLSHHRERVRQWETDLSRIIQELTQSQSQLSSEETRQFELSQQIENLVPAYAETNTQAEKAREHFQLCEQKQHEWQQKWDEFNHSASQHSREAQVEQTRIQHVEKHLQQIQERLARLETEKEKYMQTSLPLGISDLQDNIELVAREIQSHQEIISTLHQTLQTARQSHQENQKNLDEARTQLQSLKGRFASLQALQESALGKNAESRVKWLQAHNLQDKPILAQHVDVEEGYELAVETLLSDYLEAICIDDAQAGAKKDYKLEFSDLLIHKIKAPQMVADVLKNIYVAEDYAQATQMLTCLAPHESVITKDGIWLAKGWVRVRAQADQKAGVIRRERDLTDIQQAIAEQMTKVEFLQTQVAASQEKITELDKERDVAQKALSSISARHSDLNAQLKVQQAQLNQTEQRKAQLAHEVEELTQQKTQEEESLKTTRQQWQRLMENMNADAVTRENLQKERESEREIVLKARENYQNLQKNAHQQATQLEVFQTQYRATDENQSRLQKQLASLTEKQVELNAQLEGSKQPEESLTTELNALLTQQQEAEKNVQYKREALSLIENNLHECEKLLQNSEIERTTLRTQLEQRRLENQSYTTRLNTLAEQLQETGQTLEEIQVNLPPEATEIAWEINLNKILGRIERLGPINLAAISELAQQSERKLYLDQQNDDLVSALTMLEEAIHKIDKETRARFKEVYEKVNGLFEKLFPRIFGGGHAYLELTGDDLLQTGVNVIARPPGKKNSTIHLLSGGEKALTAIALVFSIFHLNPAPFCMLDEVDAPLDDANIGRFCELVKEMSSSVQFIFISHNKLAIEMAEHLIGVTMNEPGVSRLVAVDVAAAMEMADA
ncbi:MAG TPA: chromosome segregation protein SMC [Gammaproteobacteria bacterium]|nr:chromosome segregation protein SMC [Gammaproteobacteria bacterium]